MFNNAPCFLLHLPTVPGLFMASKVLVSESQSQNLCRMVPRKACPIHPIATVTHAPAVDGDVEDSEFTAL